MKIQLTVTTNGPMFNGRFKNMYKNALVQAMDETMTVAVNAAEIDYLQKKKSNPKLPSMIINSFTYKGATKTNDGVTGIAFCAKATAPWAIYVDQGHTLRNNTWWEGYNFMEAGRQAGEDVAKKIAMYELRKLSKASLVEPYY